MTAAGGGNGSLVISGKGGPELIAPPFGSSAFCSNTATYVLLYQMVEPGSALFIAH